MTVLGVDASWLQPHAAGIQQYTVNLLAAWRDASPGNRMVLCNPPLVPAEWRDRCTSLHLPYNDFLPLRLLHHRVLLPQAARRHGFDWFLAPNFVTASRVPRGCRLLLLIPDTGYLRHPELCRDGFAGVLREMVPRCLARADAVLTISRTVADELRAAYPQFAGRVTVAAPAARPLPAGPATALPSRFGLQPGEYLLGVGTREPRKNWPLAVAAFHAYRRRGGQARHLVIAGAEGWGGPEHRQPAGEGVVLAGPVSEAEKWELYRNARALVAASVYEGFGMPVLEAMAAGLPVAVTGMGGVMRELAGAAFRPAESDDPEELAGLLLTFDDRARRAAAAAAGLARAAEFSWPASAAGLDRLLQA